MPLTAHGEQSALRFASHAQRCRVHRISSRVRDDRDTPLVWDETAALIEVIWVGAERQNFLLWDSTAPITPNLARRAVDFFRDVIRHRDGNRNWSRAGIGLVPIFHRSSIQKTNTRVSK